MNDIRCPHIHRLNEIVHSLVKKMANLKETMKIATKNDRICPQPGKWNELYKRLHHEQRKNGGWEPALPIILAAWWETPDMIKQIRMREHIEWAEDHGCLDVVFNFLNDLKESGWFHAGE